MLSLQLFPQGDMSDRHLWIALTLLCIVYWVWVLITKLRKKTDLLISDFIVRTPQGVKKLTTVGEIHMYTPRDLRKA